MDDATTLLTRLDAGDTTSEALLDELLDRVEAQASLNAVVAEDVNGARQRAKEADEARARGKSWGPLHGLPMTFKDCWEVVGMPATSGFKAWRDHRPTANADAVQRLVDAGAIPFGKTNLPVLAGEWQSFNPVYGTTNNPWDPTRTPGGSSGGSAASLAAGLTPLELGSDIGGSIRIPAHFCGVFGHKPTHGLIPLRGHLPGPPGTQSEPDLAVAGPMTRSVRDLQLMFDLLIGARADEPGWSLQLPEPTVTTLSGARIAVWLDDPLCPLEADVRQVLDRAVGQLSDEGAVLTTADRRLDEVTEPYLQLLAAVIGAGLPSSVLRTLRFALPVQKLAWRFRPPVVPFVPVYLEGVLQDHRAWLSANERRMKLRASWASWFEGYDALLMPVAPWAAFPHAHEGQILDRQIEVPSGRRPYSEHLYWSGPATLLGLPSTAVPAGRTPEGLPVGMQIVAPRFGDRTTLALAAELEQLWGGFTAP